jgi:predicted metal-dependent hydrolase
VDTARTNRSPDRLTCADDIHTCGAEKSRSETVSQARYRSTVARTLAVDRAVPAVEVRRSTRRRRTVSAYRDGDTTVVLIPARFSKAEERRWVAEMVARLQARDARRERGPRRSDEALLTRARQLSGTVLDGAAKPTSVRWVSNMASRWGSCTPTDGTIRVSSRLRDMPSWVLDYVLVHELAHLLVPGHGTDFWDLVGRFPRTERARGYLEGVAAAAHLDRDDDDETPAAEVDPGAMPAGTDG